MLFLTAQDKSSSSTGWQSLGKWGVPGSVTVGPAVGGVSPAQNDTLSQNYTFTFMDTDGGQDIAGANVAINSALDGRHACDLAFVPSGPATGQVLLVDDAVYTGGPYREWRYPARAASAIASARSPPRGVR